ncbi:hypothetical protein SAZ11_05040 [Streptomyces sp. FXJ1.4098]|nr:hypothetical protein [Streptomyces sp. FXJ1.4098]
MTATVHGAAGWTPIKQGLTFHGLRHSHKTWLIEDDVPDAAVMSPSESGNWRRGTPSCGG